MYRREMTILNEYGLHTRPATALVNLASKFKSQIYLSLGDVRVNAKSILGVMVLAAEKGAQVMVEAEGEDEVQAVNAIVELANRKFQLVEQEN